MISTSTGSWIQSHQRPNQVPVDVDSISNFAVLFTIDRVETLIGLRYNCSTTPVVGDGPVRMAAGGLWTLVFARHGLSDHWRPGDGADRHRSYSGDTSQTTIFGKRQSFKCVIKCIINIILIQLAPLAPDGRKARYGARMAKCKGFQFLRL